MAYTPIYVGETHKALSVTWTDDSGVALDLTSATITVEFSGTGTSASFTGTGTVTITNAATGQFTYAFSAADVASAGAWFLQFKADFGGSGLQFSDPIQLQVLAVLA